MSVFIQTQTQFPIVHSDWNSISLAIGRQFCMCYSAWCSNTCCKHEMTINSSLLAGYWATQKPKANMGEDQWLGRNEAGLWRCLLPGLVQPFLKPELREPSACWSSSCVWNNDPRRNWAVSGSRCCHPNVAWISKASFSSRRSFQVVFWEIITCAGDLRVAC